MYTRKPEIPASAGMTMKLTDTQKRRYARNIILPEIGEQGQAKLLASKVLVIGAGGLGSAVITYLAAAGIGTIGIIDDDRVELSNLNRQILHETGDIGRIKVESAYNRIEEINPEVHVITHPERLTETNADSIISQYDLIADGCDNFTTRFLVADACARSKKPLISAAVHGFEGQLSTFKPYLGAPHPSYRDFIPEPPPEAQTCAETGVLGAVCGIMGSLQAVEIIKELLGTGESLSGSLLLYNGIHTTMRKTSIKTEY